MKLFIFLLTLSATSSYAAMSPKEFQAKLDEIYKGQTQRIQECSLQQSELREPSYKRLKKFARNHQYLELTINEVKAREVLDKYDYKKDYFEARREYKDFLASNCSKENIAIYNNYRKDEDLCDSFIQRMDFFSAMIFASSNNAWKYPNTTKLKEVILASIKNSVESNSPMIAYLTNLTTLGSLMTYNLVDGKDKNEVQSIARFGIDSLRKIYPKPSDQIVGGCDVIIKQIKDENDLRNTLRDRTLKVLSTLK